MIITGIAISVIAVIAIGLFVARKVDGDSTNFLVAGRSLALPLVAAGLMGQAVDSNATLGNTDLTSSLGFWAGASLPLGLGLCLLITGIFFAGPMNRMGLLTLPDFFRIKYGRGIELASSLLMIFSFCILLAGNLVAGGYIFERFLGVPYTAGVLLIVAIVLSYTIIGGMYSDAYTALAQMVITIFGSLALLIWVGSTMGITIPDGMGPFDFGQLTNTSEGAPINWATLVSLGIGDIVAIDFMQRIFSARTPRIARRACFVAAAGTVVVGVPYALVALTVSGVISGDNGPVLLTLLADRAPAGLAILVLSAIVAASCSTANGAILGTASVATRNVAGRTRATDAAGRDTLLRDVRITMVPVVAVAVLFAVKVPQTGILLTLAFDLMLAGLIVPFVAAHITSRVTSAAAAAAMVVGLGTRLALFVLTPTVYGAENTLLHIDNSLITASFDGWPTFIAFLAALATFLVVMTLFPAGQATVAMASSGPEPAPEPTSGATSEPVPAPARALS
ncbi:sodium:solute symporter family protein [Nocardia uniformis]|uniref:Sodium:solute symporter family protein n=1 Tax=Nocardia uniformis TaxID=53432 RepID=A0A849C1J2_9NOCA|nr:sodium:solute symporter family protein [Nocardia uniformis]NNH70225.1 sodium:solute symporter family protein [Nocardia uniformis]